MVDDKPFEGSHGICGEWGHNPLCGEDTLCYYGRKGYIETVCAGPALERYYEWVSAKKRRLPEIAGLATAGDLGAVVVLERLRVKLAKTLSSVINILDPDAIVIGGGVGNLDLLYTTETRDAILSHFFNDHFSTPLLKPALVDSDGVFGAALLSA